MKTYLALLCVLALALLAGAAPDPEDTDPEPAYRTKRYTSPRACFDAYAVAVAKKDYKTAYDCLTKDAQKDEAAARVYGMLHLRANTLGEFKELLEKTLKPNFDVMEKHGLTDKALKEARIETGGLKMPEKTRVALRKFVRKPLALLLDLSDAGEKVAKQSGVAIPGATVTLSGLKIMGNKATGTMTSQYAGHETKGTVEFVKLNVGWKMVPRLDSSAVMGGGPPVKKDRKKQ
jgi:hypothetical protein